MHISTEHPALSLYLKAKSWGRNRQSLSKTIGRQNIAPAIPAKLNISHAIILPRASCDQEAAAGISSSLGELRVSFGLLLLRLSGALMVTIWSWRRDLNPRPSDYKSDALPAELRQPTARFDTHAPTQA